MNSNFRVVDADAGCIWFEYDCKGRTYHGCYNLVEVFLEENISRKSSLFQRIERFCEEYVFGKEED